MMDGMANGAEIGALTWFLLVLVGALLIGGLFALMWWFGMPYGNRRGLERKKGRRVLDERYARGEIPRPEYERARRELEGWRPARRAWRVSVSGRRKKLHAAHHPLPRAVHGLRRAT
jgi:hypothetical protein